MKYLCTFEGLFDDLKTEEDISMDALQKVSDKSLSKYLKTKLQLADEPHIEDGKIHIDGLDFAEDEFYDHIYVDTFVDLENKTWELNAKVNNYYLDNEPDGDEGEITKELRTPLELANFIEGIWEWSPSV